MNDEPAFDPRRKKAIRELIVTTAHSSSTARHRRGARAAVVAALVVIAVGVSGGVAYALGSGLLQPNPASSGAPATSEPATALPVTPSPATPAPTRTPTAAPSAPAGPAADPADPSTWVIGFDGVGPVKLHASLEEERQELPAFTDITAPECVGGYLGLQAPNGFSLLFVGGTDQPTITAAITFGSNNYLPIDNRATTPKTAAGISLDSTKDELLAAYPGIEKTGAYQSDDDPYYGLTDGAGGWIVFGISDNKVGRIQIANESMMPTENVSVKTMPSERCPA